MDNQDGNLSDSRGHCGVNSNLLRWDKGTVVLQCSWSYEMHAEIFQGEHSDVCNLFSRNSASVPLREGAGRTPTQRLSRSPLVLGRAVQGVVTLFLQLIFAVEIFRSEKLGQISCDKASNCSTLKETYENNKVSTYVLIRS